MRSWRSIWIYRRSTRGTPNDETGRLAYDPKILLKVILYGYYKGIISSRKLAEACRRRNTREQVADYIDNYYNLVRLHSHLDYVSPIEFETNAPR